MTTILVTGASGQLGGYLLQELCRQELPAVGWSSSRKQSLFDVPLEIVDLSDPPSVAAALERVAPTLILHAGAMSSVGACHQDPDLAFAVNVDATGQLAELAAQAGARLVFTSTDLVFDGQRGNYQESDEPQPSSVYGSTKAAAERRVLAFTQHLVVRISLLFGPTVVERPAFFDSQLRALQSGQPCRLFEDEWRTPLSLEVAARGLIAALQSEVSGVLHFGGPERLSRYAMGRKLAEVLQANPGLVVASRQSEVAAPEPRPQDVSLDSSRWRASFPSLDWPDVSTSLRSFEFV